MEAPRFYPYLSGREEPRAAGRARRRRRRRAHRRGARHRRASPTARATASAATRTACASGSASPAALLRDPRLLLLDEPTTGLDPGGHARHARAGPPPGGRGDDRAAVEPPARRGGGALRPRGDRAHAGAIVYEGRLERTARAPPAAATGCGPPTTSCAERSAARSRASGACSVARAASSLLRRRGRRRRAFASRWARRASASARSMPRARRRSRSSSSGSRRAGPAGRPSRSRRWALSAWRRATGRRRRSTAGSCASCARRSAPTSGSARRSRVPLLFVVAMACSSGGPEDVAVRPLHPRHRPGDPARAAAVRLDLDVPADHRAGGGRHRRLRGRQRHAQDDPHPLRSSAGRSSAARLLAALTYAVAAIVLNVAVGAGGGHHRVGLRPARHACPARRCRRRSGPALVGASMLVYLMPISRSPASALLLSTITRNSAAAVVGTLMFSLILQLIGDPARASAACTRTCSDAVRRLAGPAAPADRLGSRWCARRGSARSTRCRRCSSGLPRLPAPRRGRRLSAQPSGSALVCAPAPPPARAGRGPGASGWWVHLLGLHARRRRAPWGTAAPDTRSGTSRSCGLAPPCSAIFLVSPV